MATHSKYTESVRKFEDLINILVESKRTDLVIFLYDILGIDDYEDDLNYDEETESSSEDYSEDSDASEDDHTRYGYSCDDEGFHALI